jgi:glucokinase
MYSIGIEITKKEIRAGLVKLGEKPELVEVTFAAKGEDKLAIIGELCHKLVGDANITVDDVDHVGVAAGEKLVGTKCGCCGTDLCDIKNYFPVKKVYATKKPIAKAIAEETMTYGRGYSFAYIDLGEKIGFGLTIGGKPYVGSGGQTSDVAHTTIIHGGKQCRCGNRGCFEAYCNLEAFENTERAEYESLLACAVTNVMNLFQPNVIVLGGEVAERGGDELLEAFGAIVHTENYARNSEHRTLLALPSIGANAAVIGAALLEE